MIQKIICGIFSLRLHTELFLIIDLGLITVTDKSKAAAKKDSSANKDDSGTVFQMQRVDMLLAELLRKFPPPIPPIIHQQQMQQHAGGPPHQNPNNPQETNANNVQDTSNAGNNGNPTESSPTGAGSNPGIDIKQENVDMKPPPEKKSKTN